MQQELMTIAQLAKELQLPESTVRYYRDRFTEYIPATGEGRHRRYRPEAVEVLRFIADGLRNDLTATQVAEQLSRMFPRTIEVQNEPQQPTAAAQQQSLVPLELVTARALERMAAALTEMANQKQEIDNLRAELQELRNAQQQHHDQYQQEIDERDRRLVERMREMMEERKQPQPWWKRLFHS